MPELPELEAIRQYLVSSISEQVITNVKTFLHTVIRKPSALEFEELLNGSTLDQIERIGKILRFSFHKSDLILNLYIDHGLTGRLAWSSNSRKVPAKTVFSLEFGNGRILIYHDARLHGAIWLFSNKNNQPSEEPAVIDNFGPDIVKISESEFINRLTKFRGEIKGILTNQRFVTGIGNAYSDEILFEAKTHPFSKRPELSKEDQATLYLACKYVLSNATEQISQILESTQKLDNERYWRQEVFRVHLKDKQPCPICGSPISTIKAKRITNFCRKCQVPTNRDFI